MKPEEELPLRKLETCELQKQLFINFKFLSSLATSQIVSMSVHIWNMTFHTFHFDQFIIQCIN